MTTAVELTEDELKRKENRDNGLAYFGKCDVCGKVTYDCPPSCAGTVRPCLDCLFYRRKGKVHFKTELEKIVYVRSLRTGQQFFLYEGKYH